MKIQSNQPAGTTGAGYPADAPQETPSSSFSDVMAKKSQEEPQAASSEPAEPQPAAETQEQPASQSSQPETQPHDTAQSPQARSAVHDPNEQLPFEQSALEQPLFDQPITPFSAESVPSAMGMEQPLMMEGPWSPDAAPLMTDAGVLIDPATGLPLDPQAAAHIQGRHADEIPGRHPEFPVVGAEKKPGPAEQKPAGAESLDAMPGATEPGIEKEPPPGGGEAVEGKPPKFGVPHKDGERTGGADHQDSIKKPDGENDEDQDWDDLEDAGLPSGAPPPIFQLKTDAPAPVQAPEAPRPLQDMQKIRALVQEVRLVSAPGDKQQMDIQLNSRTLDGLQIRIERDEGRMTIQFATRNDDVAQLLSRNMQNLSQSLAAHGLRVANIQVVNPMAMAQAQATTFQPLRTASTAQADTGSGREDAREREERQGRDQGRGQEGRRGRQ